MLLLLCYMLCINICYMLYVTIILLCYNFHSFSALHRAKGAVRRRARASSSQSKSSAFNCTSAQNYQLYYIIVIIYLYYHYYTIYIYIYIHNHLTIIMLYHNISYHIICRRAGRWLSNSGGFLFQRWNAKTNIIFCKLSYFNVEI